MQGDSGMANHCRGDLSEGEFAVSHVHELAGAVEASPFNLRPLRPDHNSLLRDAGVFGHNGERLR